MQNLHVFQGYLNIMPKKTTMASTAVIKDTPGVQEPLQCRICNLPFQDSYLSQNAIWMRKISGVGKAHHQAWFVSKEEVNMWVLGWWDVG